MNPQVLLAIQLLTKTVTDLPLAIQTVLSGSQPPLPSGVSWTGPGQRPGTAPAQGAGQDVARVYVTNSNWAAPLPVTIVGGAAPKEQKEKAPDFPTLPGFTQLAARVTAVAGPLAILSAAIGSSTSGFQTLGVGVKVLAGTLAPVLLPATLLLSTALVALSDVVSATLVPGMQGFFGLIIGMGVPALVLFVDAVVEGTRKLQEWGAEAGRVLALFGSGGAGSDQNPGDVLSGLLNTIAPGLGDLARAGGDLLAASEDLRPESGGGKSLVLDALRDVMGSLALSIGPKAQISGLEGVGKSAQLAAFNQDPLEARMLRTTQQIYALLQRAVETATAGRGVWMPGDGMFGSGSGADFGRGDF